MKTLLSRFRRHLTYANVMASVAVFLALGGVGYAATTINGNKIVKHSIGAGKLKKRTLGSNQMKKDSLTGTVIDESTLSIVPQAQAAAVAEEAETLEGVTQEELTLSCPAGTALFGGMCWDETVRPAHFWIKAAVECGKAGGRLPTLSELIAYIAQEGVQFPSPAWVSDVVSTAGALVVEESGDAGLVSEGSDVAEHGFRCLFYRSN